MDVDAVVVVVAMMVVVVVVAVGDGAVSTEYCYTVACAVRC